MNYGQVFYADTANGIGARISLFVSGCTHHCPGCFNEETWDFNFGEPFTREVEDDIIEHLRPSYIDGLSLLGGEPMEAQNQRALLPFLERVKQEVPHATIGFTQATPLRSCRTAKIRAVTPRRPSAFWSSRISLWTASLSSRKRM